MNNYTGSANAITALLLEYFQGIFNGDIKKLSGIFHPWALVAGDVNGHPYFKTVDQYIGTVKDRKSPAALNEPFRMEILSIEIINSMAMAKVRVSMYEFNYYNFLSLAKMNEEWVIMSKLLTNVKP